MLIFRFVNSCMAPLRVSSTSGRAVPYEKKYRMVSTVIMALKKKLIIVAIAGSVFAGAGCANWFKAPPAATAATKADSAAARRSQSTAAAL